ncbi:glutaredoxin family protein [Bacillus sp. ISL-35]|uniref:glutaredoxin family protein n=1 Tax=Bacillus sp. ISL-35 TaxID=2819122 RepID=UPI001BE515A5|nr:glutaredoxin family protein [Bacillus sp. ISL-35]MBT2678386.1 glutaredoxin family protein [Bacillus sp. ISL-35]MBT2705890.1 glutaredoxin family protein [Chryseobacterium sp. ISL-80]
MNDIIVYTQNDCPSCKIIKMFLTEFNFSFTEKNISEDDSSRQELTHTYNSYSTPTIVVGEEVITGFDLERLKQVLDIKE